MGQPHGDELAHQGGRPASVLLLWTTAPAFIVLGALLHKRYYAHGFTKAQEGAGRTTGGRGLDLTIGKLLSGLTASKREFILKDLRIFFRDTQQWSQLILLAVLLVVYLSTSSRCRSSPRKRRRFPW